MSRSLLSNAMILPGWTCTVCRGFNGEAKERLEACRYCDAPRPGIVSYEEARKLALAALDGKPIESYVKTCVQLAALVANGTSEGKDFSKAEEK